MFGGPRCWHAGVIEAAARTVAGTAYFRNYGAITAINQALLYRMMKDGNAYGVDLFILSQDELNEWG